MRPPQYVIGLDGGGTKTAAELCDQTGHILATASGGPSHFQVIGVAQSATTIMDLIETCCHSVGCSVRDIGSICAGITGAGRADDQKRMASGLRAEADRRGTPLRRISVESDARIALEGAFSGGPGIIVVSGTGSIVFGKGKRGAVYRSGGWGRALGDEGSGYALGRELFRAVAAEIDGRGRKSMLRSLLSREYSLKTQSDIIRAIYQEGFDIASAAPLVTKAAARRDKVAQDILAAAADDLVNVILPVAGKLGANARRKGGIPLAMLGSVLSPENSFSAALRRSLTRHCPVVTVRPPDASPVHGASLFALRMR